MHVLIFASACATSAQVISGSGEQSLSALLTSSDGRFLEIVEGVVVTAERHQGQIVESKTASMPEQTTALFVMWALYTLISAYHLGELYSQRATMRVAARSSALLGVAAVTGWLTLGALCLVQSLGIVDDITQYIWMTGFALPLTVLAHTLRALRLCALCQRRDVVDAPRLGIRQRGSGRSKSKRSPRNGLVDRGVEYHAKIYKQQRHLRILSERCAEPRWIWVFARAAAACSVFATACQVIAHKGGLVSLALASASAAMLVALLVLALCVATLGAAVEPFGVRLELRSLAMLGFVLPPVVAYASPSALLALLGLGSLPVRFNSSVLALGLGMWLLLALVVSTCSVSLVVRSEKVVSALYGKAGDECSLASTLADAKQRSAFENFVSEALQPELVQCLADICAFHSKFNDPIGMCDSPASSSASSGTDSPPGSPRRSASFSCDTIVDIYEFDHSAYMQVIARHLYRKYIKDGAPTRVMLDDTITNEISYRLASNNATALMFSGAQGSVRDQLASIHPLFLARRRVQRR